MANHDPDPDDPDDLVSSWDESSHAHAHRLHPEPPQIPIVTPETDLHPGFREEMMEWVANLVRDLPGITTDQAVNSQPPAGDYDVVYGVDQALLDLEAQNRVSRVERDGAVYWFPVPPPPS